MGLLFLPLFSFFLNGVALFFLTKIVTEIQFTGGIKFFVVGGIVIGILNFLVKPLLKILSLPLIVLSAGLFLIFINAFLLWLLEFFVRGLAIEGVTLNFPDFKTYLIGAIVFGVVNWAMHLISK